VIEEAQAQLERLRQQFPLQAADLEPQTFLRLTDNWVELSIRFLVRAWGIRSVKDGVTRVVLARYREEGISIASASFEVARLPEVAVRAAGNPRGTAP
jgi:small-conductance mechanosensitive channel